MKGTTLQIVKGVCSRSYLQDLAGRRIPTGSLNVYRSEPYDLLEHKDRKEFVRIFIGLFQCLYHQIGLQCDLADLRPLAVDTKEDGSP